MVTKDDKGGADSPELPHIDFSTFVVSLSHSALVHLGDAADADGSVQKDLPLARQTIDILALLQEKTKGNLDGDEERLLNQVLYDLRLRFVEIAQGGKLAVENRWLRAAIPSRAKMGSPPPRGGVLPKHLL